MVVDSKEGGMGGIECWEGIVRKYRVNPQHTIGHCCFVEDEWIDARGTRSKKVAGGERMGN